ncbi:unnamed protein product [Diatraea saccharalis]|uniref:Uncharacterized protein n=1 Tax=Diatraea saccharalis TaxID=40085 RepID=A0A9N9R8D0_9NEOP|nr:unnamed protein product [Diatraea saccharalis]
MGLEVSANAGVAVVSVVWSGKPSAPLARKLCRLTRDFCVQKRAIRSIYSLRIRDSLKGKFKEIVIMTVASQYKYESLMYVRKNITLFTILTQEIRIN